MKNLIGISLFLAMLIFASCEEEQNKGDNNGQAATEIFMRGSTFSPSTLTITAGTIVKWTNNDNTPHTVSNPQGLFDSGTINPGATFSFAFNATGTYSYFCQIHPNMTGTIVVN